MSFALLLTLLSFAPLEREAGLQPYVEAMRGRFRPGGLVAVQLHEGVIMEMNGEAVADYEGLAVVGFGRDEVGEVVLRFRKGGDSVVLKRLLETRVYKTEYVEGVAPKYVTPPPEVLARIKREGVKKREARVSRYDTPQLAGGFAVPLEGRVSGVYGSQRFFNGEPRRPHYGLDIAVPLGTPVKASQAGRVSLAEEDMYYEGGLVFIDHGLGVVSAYLHLAEFAVKEGDIVAQGEVIGAVGSRGRSTGPHLDWRVFWYDKRLDPALLVE